MDDLDPRNLANLLTRLLSSGAAATPADDDGWVSIAEICHVASAELERTIIHAHVERAGESGTRLEISGTRIRVQTGRAAHRDARHVQAPDVLFHATTREAVLHAGPDGVLQPEPRRRLLLSADEAQAWRAAHRLTADEAHASHTPQVLAVDVPRLRRAGIRLQRARNGPLWVAPVLPLRHILSLRDGFDHQLSAGGIPLTRFPDGSVRMALIRVSRRSGTTWEVAKGKLEPGEPPEVAAVREVQEEMGLDANLSVLRYVAPVRYCFLAPGGSPRLKTIFLYLLHADGPLEPFRPAAAEGIGDVAWFTPEDAAEAVRHPSLVPVMRRARDLVLSGAVSVPDRATQPPNSA